MSAPWIHPAHGRAHLPTRHQRTVSIMHHIARASNTPDRALHETGTERLIRAITGGN